MKEISLQDLLEAGCHFGHQSTKLHPKARTFIFTKRDKVHIIDLAKTKEGLEKAAEFVEELGKKGAEILFVATKRQAKGTVAEVAEKVAGIHHFTRRFIGGFLTNFDEVKKNIEKLNKMEIEEKKGEWKKFTKHEQAKLKRELVKLNILYGGVKDVKELPEALFIVDIQKEAGVLREARRQGVSVVAIVDTNADPVLVDYPIPANDDAVGSIRYITEYIGEAYKEGKTKNKKLKMKNTNKK